MAFPIGEKRKWRDSKERIEYSRTRMGASEALSRDELTLLVETADKLSAQIDQEKLVQMILETACKMTSSPDGSILLYDEERHGLYFAAAQGEKSRELLEAWGEGSNQRVPLLGSNAGEAFTSGHISLNDQSSHFKGVDEQTGKQSQSLLSAPLCIGSKSIGVLQILNKKGLQGKLAEYDERDRVLIGHLSRQAATAINNARLIGKLLAHMGLYARDGVEDLIGRVNRPAQRERLTLLFADMRGFTQLCQSQDTRRTQEIVNDLLTMFADQVLTRGGIVNKFLGDAVFAIFRQEGGPKQAVRCAFGMLDRFQSLRHRWDDACNEDLSFLDIGIGIVTDDVALGSIGNASVRDFTAIGTPVNLAHAFEQAARNGRRILVDQSTWSGAQDLIADFEGPNSFELRKPDQNLGIKFRQYHLKRLKPEIPVRVFVSHNHQDRTLANHISEQLARCGIQTWYSGSDIVPGKNYIEAIEAGLIKSDWVIVIVSKNSIGSDWVKAEIKTAVRDPRFAGRILPVRIDDSKASSVSDDLSFVQGVDGREEENLGETIREVLLAAENQLRSKTIGL